MLRWSAVVVLVGATLAVCGESTVPATGAVTRSERTWVDTTRPTPPNSMFKGAPSRTLRTLIWQPTTRTPVPLLVMAHGFDSLAEWFDAMAQTIAGHGFVDPKLSHDQQIDLTATVVRAPMVPALRQ